MNRQSPSLGPNFLPKAVGGKRSVWQRDFPPPKGGGYPRKNEIHLIPAAWDIETGSERDA